MQDHGLYLCCSHNKLFKVKKKKSKGVKSAEYQSEWRYCMVCFLLSGALHFKNTCCGFSVIISPLPVLCLPYCKYPFVGSCFSCISHALCLSSYSLTFSKLPLYIFFLICMSPMVFILFSNKSFRTLVSNPSCVFY